MQHSPIVWVAGYFLVAMGPPLIPCADSSLRYFSALPPPPPPPPPQWLWGNAKGQQAGAWKQNYFPRLLFQMLHSCQLKRQKKGETRGNVSSWPEVTIYVSSALRCDYCSFLRETGEEGGGHECCHNALQCKEWGLIIKGSPLYYYKFSTWLTCFRGAAQSE